MRRIHFPVPALRPDLSISTRYPRAQHALRCLLALVAISWSLAPARSLAQLAPFHELSLVSAPPALQDPSVPGTAATRRDLDPVARPTDDWRHLHLDVTNLGLDEPEEDSTYALSLGANYTIPILPRSLLAAQLGGDVTFREKGTELDVTTGVFHRGLQLADELELGGAVLVDFRHTQRDGDLFGLRPVIGIDIGELDSIGLEGLIALNDETVERAATGKLTQRMATRVDAHWGRDWNQEWTTDLAAGYMFGDVDSPVVGGQVTFALTRSVNLAGRGEVNFEGDYAVGLSVVFDLASTGRASTVRRYGKKHGLVPFTKRSFPFIVTELRDETRSGNPTVNPIREPRSELPPPQDDDPSPGQDSPGQQL